MVYPVLEAATPPPLVQSPSALARSPDGAFPTPIQPQPIAATSAVSSLTQSSTLPKADDLGPSVSIPPEFSNEDVRFSTTPVPLFLGVTSQSHPNIETLSPAPDKIESSVKASPAIAPKAPKASRSLANIPTAPLFSQFPVQENQPPPSSPPPNAPLSTPPSASPDLAPAYPSDNLQTPGTSFIELSADRQEYNTLEGAVTAVGNVLLNYRQAQLKADRVQTLVPQKQVVAEGNVQLTRGAQVLQGDRLEYLLSQERGILFKPRGIINLPSASQDLSPKTPATSSIGSNPLVGIQKLQRTQPTLESKDGIQRLRFEADRIEFTAQTWRAVNVRITSDPFSPPELELRANQADLQRVSAQEDVVVLQRPRLVFDQALSVPIPRKRIALSRKRQNPFSVNFGFDDRDRGGLFVGQQFTPISSRVFTLSVTPQIFLQRAIFDKQFNFIDPDVYGIDVELKGEFSPKTTLSGYTVLRSLDLTNFADNVRAGLRLRQQVGLNNLDFEAAYRERVFNGSLDELTVQNRFGVIFSAPTRPIGQTGIDFSYRLAAEAITAQTDTFDLLRNNTLGRFQGSVSLQRAFDLWKGQALPPTATEGLRYTPEPIVPYFRLVAGATGVASGYTNGDSQTTLIGRIRFEGQFGHFSKQYLDYTSFYLGFSQGLQLGESPFLFDRVVDRQVLSAGFLQQVYGPIRLGFQASINLDTGEFFNTDIILDYSRRTYGLTLRYNPNLQVGSIVFRINSFNWVGNRDPLTGPGIGVVEGGVEQTNDPF